MDTPLNKAHVHAMNAEEYKTRGLLVKAAEEHYLAAEGFKRAMESSSAEGTKRTLRMLYQDHNNSGKELQRKIAELEAQGKDPSVPQLQPQPPSRRSSSSSVVGSSSIHQYPPSSAASSTSRSSSRMGDSQMPIGESYMMLEGQNADTAAFKDFFENVEGLLQRFSSPVAFASAPLSPTPTRLSQVQSVSSSSDSSDAEDGLGTTVQDRHQPLVLESLADALSDQVTLNDSLSSTLKPKNGKGKPPVFVTPDDVYADDDSSSSESFFVIPTTPTVKSLQTENARMREQLKAAEERLAAAEKHIKQRADQEQQLRDGLLNARQQMQQRLGASTVLPQPIVDMSFPNLKIPGVPGLSPLAAPVPPPLPLSGPTRDRETMLIRRTRELEDELRGTREENDKLRAQIVKFRERWAKLKESAKRKRSARAAAEAGRIEEEPEGEEAEAGEN
ncbi:hypothetical protein EXIGLDRAFT_677124 [Exidia glandulosa HHB12029]|uniref:MIT domain-containing protein n=1 Tax=Exidia glandulosa HHB12029 TaxID=1314781 RepID=A0A165GF36_EXIGL|nr:hypothetical protein EXIGLDRAFT_677124 [Exidia glandulosa HHB12029]